MTYAAYAGNTLQVRVTVLDETGAALNLTGASLIYILCDSAGAEVLRKTSEAGEITTSGNVATIAIDAGDTDGLAEAYHELQCTDALGYVSTLLAGMVVFEGVKIDD